MKHIKLETLATLGEDFITKSNNTYCNYSLLQLFSSTWEYIDYQK